MNEPPNTERDALEQRVRALIASLEAWTPVPSFPPDPVRDHWFDRGMDEAYDDVIWRLYTDVLGEEM
jgi:hypothetical protein